MGLFDRQINDIRGACNEFSRSGVLQRLSGLEQKQWPPGGDRNFVMKQDTAVELGSPRTDAISLTLWTQNSNLVIPDQISLVGQDLDQCEGRSIPFGQIILLDVEAGSTMDDYKRFRFLESVKYKLDLKGYMRRGASQFLREWSRVSREALDSGFNMQTMGQELIRLYGAQDMVRGVEVLLITEAEPLERLKPLSVQVQRTVAALHKMLNEDMTDCDDCEYSDICREVEALRKLRQEKPSHEK